MNKKNTVILCVALALFTFVLVPFVINVMFKAVAPCKWFVAAWLSGDALGYVGGALAFIGTMFLGLITWKQNAQLKKLEDDKFIADNACFALIEKMKFTFSNNIPVNYQIHDEQMLLDDKLDKKIVNRDFVPMGFKCEITLSHITNYPAMVFIKSCTFFVGNSSNHKMEAHLFTTNISNKYTRIAISKDQSYFEATILVDRESNDSLMKAINTSICLPGPISA